MAAMQTRKLGPSGLTVSAIGLGGMPLSIQNHPDEATGVRVIHAALDAGMTLIDTADCYCIDDADLGANERLIARALRERAGAREAVVVASKGGLERPGGAWTTNARPEHLARACERSLKALGVGPSSSTSCTRRTRRCRSRTRWERSRASSSRARSATWACPT